MMKIISLLIISKIFNALLINNFREINKIHQPINYAYIYNSENDEFCINIYACTVSMHYG